MTPRRAHPQLNQPLQLAVPDRLPLRRRMDPPLNRATAIRLLVVRPQRTVSRPRRLTVSRPQGYQQQGYSDPAAGGRRRVRSADPAALRSADASGIPATGLPRSKRRLPATGLPAGLRRISAAGLSAVRRPEPAGIPAAGICAAAVRPARLSAAAIRAARPDAGVGKR